MKRAAKRCNKAEGTLSLALRSAARCYARDDNVGSPSRYDTMESKSQMELLWRLGPLIASLNQSTRIKIASPWPPPLQIAAIPSPPPRRRSW
jgi:hypothetical protein